MSHAPNPRPAPSDSVPIRLDTLGTGRRAAAEPDPRPVGPPADPRPVAARPKRTLPVGIEPLLGIAELCARLNCSRRILERMRSAGRVPRPDFQLGKCPRWKPETIRLWIERGGKQ